MTTRRIATVLLAAPAVALAAPAMASAASYEERSSSVGPGGAESSSIVSSAGESSLVGLGLNIGVINLDLL
ncbi:hypothetical protein HDA32_005945 [Spinactinospora alkalitolerans]|uniref:Uncharacterized protein n=1 Tax=Spinactinospora alkalitolerans TaxID=687207 RepID=A0A852U5H8_9ACTN|nr:hypothetical protein [Spinactinospora alkalitolerans]NYE50825.1 hypothetical protein [Spinactinospora alkalitolerans]